MQHAKCDEIVKITNIVLGNGAPGIAKLVAAHETYIQQQIGSWKTVKAVMVFLGISNIGTLAAFLIQTFGK